MNRGFLLFFVFVHPLMAHSQEWNTLSGNIELLRGYVDHLRPGAMCYDSNCGEIWKPGGLIIEYELNNGSYELEEDRDFATFVYCKDVTNGQAVELAVEIDSTDKTKRVHISYPNEAIFSANVRTASDIRTMMRMILTFRGKHYEKSEKRGATVCGGLRDEVNNAFSQMQVRLTNLSTHERRTVETDEGGHFKFGDLPPGTYRLQTTAYQDELGCEYPPKHWRIRVRQHQKLLLYRVMTSVTKNYACRAD